MKRVLLLALAALLLISGPAQAAYTTATIIANEPQPDGRRRLLVRFNGSGETAVDRDYYITDGTTAATLKAWAIGVADGLNNIKTLANAAALQAGQVVDLSAITPPVQTAFQVWMQKAARLKRATDLGLTNATAVSELATLRADVNATFVSGYWVDF